MNIRNPGSVSGNNYRQWGYFGRAKPVAKKKFVYSRGFAAIVAIAAALVIVLGQSHQRDKNELQGVPMGNVYHVPVVK